MPGCISLQAWAKSNLAEDAITNPPATTIRETSEPARPRQGKPLQIDIPVKLVKTVLSIDALAFEGELPASLFHLQLIENDITDSNAKAEVIALFHTNAGHVTLNNSACNADRNVATGNPYKGMVADLQKRGVPIEGATAKAHHWGNADRLPGIKVNTDGIARTTQLVQDGFVKITEQTLDARLVS